jgi:hypothetical protein
MRTVWWRKNLRWNAAIPTVLRQWFPEAGDAAELGMRLQQNRRSIGRKPTLEPCSTLYETFGGYSTLNSRYEKE